MLRRSTGLLTVLGLLGLLGPGTGAAHADGGVVKCNGKGVCRLVAKDVVATAGRKGVDSAQAPADGSAVKSECYDSLNRNKPVPCHREGLGSWVNGMNCYFQPVDPPPPAGNPQWEGHAPEDGAVFDAYCPNNPNMTSRWFAQPPAGAAAVDPEQLALQAVEKMTLLGPDITSPRATGRYVVGVPMWMWVNQSATTYGPNTASASAGAVTVTATAKVTKIVWRMGDGATVTCAGPGTPYTGSAGMAESPTCGHVYAKTSAGVPGGKYEVTAMSTWTIDWQGGGASGQLTEMRQSEVQVAIGEVQVVR